VAAATVLLIGRLRGLHETAFIAIGMQSDVFRVFDRSIDRLRELNGLARGGLTYLLLTWRSRDARLAYWCIGAVLGTSAVHPACHTPTAAVDEVGGGCAMRCS